jgi:NAD+ synthase
MEDWVNMLTKDALRINPSAVQKSICNFIKAQIQSSGTEGVVIGMSGGIDSSLVAALCSNALGQEGVLGLLMPSETTPPQDMRDARSLGEALQIDQEVVEIQSLGKTFTEICGSFNSTDLLAKGNLQPRFRMLILYYYANRLNRLVVGSGNRSELLVGYFTKYGDGGVDILPIGDLYKTQVRQLATFLDLPEVIIMKPPSAGFWPGQTDEGELGIKYEVLDFILYGLLDLKMDCEEIAEALQVPLATVGRVLKMNENSEHKRRLPPIPKCPPFDSSGESMKP